MSLILSGTNGLSDVDGSAATPAIRGTDTNTGIFFPAADTIAFAEGGVESMRLTADGRLGIGTATPFGTLAVANGSNENIEFGSGNVSLNGGYIQYINRTTAATRPDMSYYLSAGGGAHKFYTNDLERARIDSSGRLLVGTTSTTGAGERLSVLQDNNNWMTTFRNSNASAPYGLQIWYTGSSPNDTTKQFLYLEDTTAKRAEFRSNGGLANYSANNVNLSDRREKTNFAPAGDYLAKICAIPVQTFNYIDQNLEQDDGLTLGVVAQDVQAVAPELVMESDWGTQEEPKMRLSIYQTDLQYALMKSIQELKAEFDAYKLTHP
jgi:hypothetical protein